MKFEEVSWYSERLGRNMRIKIYGHYGPCFIAFPCQGKQSDDFSNHGMIDAISWFLENGKMKLFCLDSNDDETVSSISPDKAHAAYKLEMYHQYFISEVIPFIYKNYEGGHCMPYLIGCSMGASHAVNNFLRRPELFSGFIALSGKYDVASFFNGYFDDNVYNNSPVHYLRNIDPNHPYINIYNQKNMTAVVGRGAYEFLVLESNFQLADIAKQKGIHMNYNFWDEFSVHDWKSWNYQMPYFLGKIL